jgi:hypothetical protein
MKCDLCLGRGWALDHHKLAVPCSFCAGRGEISWGLVARKLDEDPGTLARMRIGRSRRETCLRVLDKVCRALWPKGQQEMFR